MTVRWVVPGYVLDGENTATRFPQSRKVKLEFTRRALYTWSLFDYSRVVNIAMARKGDEEVLRNYLIFIITVSLEI